MTTDEALSAAMKFVEMLVDSDEFPASVRYDAQQLLFRWQRGEWTVYRG